MIYLDNAATSMPKPPEVYAAVQEAMLSCASLGRSGHAAARKAAETAFLCRQEAGELFGTDPEQVVFTMNATHGLNLAIKTLVKPGDRVVVSGFEHNAVMRPLHHLGAQIETAGSRLFDPDDTLAAFDHAITLDTKAVICTHVSNVFGYVLPVEQVAALCRRRGVPLIVDAAQSAGILPLSLKQLQAAFIAMPGHKGLYGPQGTGMLLCGQTPDTLFEGGTGSLSASLDMPDFLPDRVEAGTHNVPGIAGLLAGIRYLKRRGLTAVGQGENALLRKLHRELRDLPIRQYYAGGTLQTGVLSLTAEGWDCEELAARLSDAGIAVRAGLHCAPMAHKCAGTLETGTIRVSLSDFTTPQEIDRFAETLGGILGN